jgi:hypothetical protein
MVVNWRTHTRNRGDFEHIGKKSPPTIFFAEKYRQSASKLRASPIQSPSAGHGTLPRTNSLARLSALSALSAHVFPNSPHRYQRQDGGREKSKFEHLEKTKDLPTTPGETHEPDVPEPRALHANPARRIIGGQSAKPRIAACVHQFPMANLDSLPRFQA